MKIIAIIGTIVIMLGVILVYDARSISKNIFSFGDQNEATVWLKLIGFIMTMVGGFLLII